MEILENVQDAMATASGTAVNRAPQEQLVASVRKPGHLALAQAAKSLFHNFGLKYRPLLEDNGQVLVKCSVSVGTPWRRRGYTAESVRELRRMRDCLADFAEWAQDPITAAILQRECVGCIDRKVVARSKFTFGAIDWITFEGTVHIRFSPELGLKFRQFIAHYGPSAPAQA